MSSQEGQGSLLPLTAAILTSFVAFNSHTYIFAAEATNLMLLFKLEIIPGPK